MGAIEKRPITYQPVFAKVARTRPDLCRQMVERVLGRRVEGIELAQSEYDAGAVTHRGVRFDVLLEGADELVEVEMQASSERGLPRRLRYYHAHIDQMLLDKGETVDRLRPVYVIFLCLRDPFGGGLPVYTFRSRCVEDPGMGFDDGAESVVVAAANFEREDDPGRAALMRYLLTNVPGEGDPLTVELAQAVDKAYEDESWVGTMLTYEQEIAHKEYVAREEGEEIGRAEGEKIGRAEASRRYDALLARLGELGYGDGELGRLLRENTLDQLFAKFEIA